MKAAMPPRRWASAMTWRARVVLPEDSGPKISTTRPRGIPPTPRAASRESEPVGIAGTSTFSRLPRRMIEPLPNCLSICAGAAAIAWARLCRSSTAICPSRRPAAPPTPATTGGSYPPVRPGRVHSEKRMRIERKFGRMVLPLVAVLAASSLDVPFVAQRKDTCGAAALAMVLRYWGDDATHDDVARTLLTPELHGIAGSRLAEFARGRGMEAVAYKGDVANLRDFVGKGRPLIVAWDMGRGRYHDVVVIGFDDQRRTVVVHNPAEGASRAVKSGTFEKRWAGAGYWTLFVARDKAAPGPPSYEELVARGVAAGRRGSHAEAEDALQRAIAAAPSRPEARVELAGLRLPGKKYEDAAAGLPPPPLYQPP